MLQNTWVPFARCSLFYKPRTLLHCLKSLLSLRYCFRQPAHQPSWMSFWMSDEYACIELFINSHWIFIPLLTNLFSVGVLFSVNNIRLHRLCSERSVCDDSRGNFPHFLMGHRRYLLGGNAKTIKPDKRKLVLSFDDPNIRSVWAAIISSTKYYKSHRISFIFEYMLESFTKSNCWSSSLPLLFLHHPRL